jgi:hypothetical protein
MSPDNQKTKPGEGQGAKRPKEEKRALILVIVLGIFAVSFGIYQLYSGLTGPFKLSKLANEETNTSSEQEQLIAELHNKDTDKDGLVDYDELYVYHTSPYLADSDSDGINDKQEIDSGTDPNCPQGQVCQQATTANTNATTNTNSVSINLNAAGTPDVSSLRQALIDAGAPANDVNSLSDEELLQMYQEVMNEQTGGTTNLNSAANTNTTSNINSNTNTASSNTNSAVTIETLQNLTAAQIREFLIQNGISADTLNQIDDATLKSIFLQALSEQTQSQ